MVQFQYAEGGLMPSCVVVVVFISVAATFHVYK